MVSGIIFLIYDFAGDHFLSGFLIGQIFFVIFHIAIFWLGRLQIAYRRYLS